MTAAAYPSTVLVVAGGESGRIVDLLRRSCPAASVRAAADATCGAGGAELLLADARLPDADALELARRLRSGAGAESYLIVLAPAMPPDGLAAIGALADDLVLAPVRDEEVAARVAIGLRRVAARAAVAGRAAELERLHQRQSEFLSHVSHEIRTPLSAILSSASILRRYGRQRPESVERFAAVIHQEGQRLTRLINNLLDLAKIEAGQVEWRFEPVSLATLLAEVRDSFAAQAGERQLDLELLIAGETCDLIADRDQLTQVLVNLISNAIKHAPDGSVVSLRCAAAGSDRVRVEVEDRGAGVPPGMEERIFERFRTTDAGDERGGTGLGLTIARQIVEHHGGRIWSEAGRSAGGLFVVELPFDPRGGADGSVR